MNPNDPIVAIISSSDGKYHVEITLSQMAFLQGMLQTTSYGYATPERNRDSVFERIFDVYPGGQSALRQDIPDIVPLYEFVVAVNQANNMKSAPWRKPQAPNEIHGHKIQYSIDGIKVGCQHIPLDQMKAMIQECEERF